MPQALTTLANVKEWLGLPASQTASDGVLSRLIMRASQGVYSYTSRSSFTPRSVTEVIDGDFRCRLMLSEYPVLAISRLAVNGVPVPQAATTQSAGFLLEPWNGYPPGHCQAVDLFGYDTGYGAQGTQVTYTAGYQVTSEAQTVPANPGPYVVLVDAPFGPWFSDGRVVYAATGTPLTLVAASPGLGQYVMVSTALGEYQFSAADAGAAVQITYGYVPADVEQAVLEFIGERNAYRERIGIRSKNLTAGSSEAISYQPTGMTDSVRQWLQPYRRVMTG